MPTSTPPTDPDASAVLHVLDQADVSSPDAHNALGGIRNMAGRAVTAAIEILSAKIEGLNTKIDAQDAKIAALIDAQNAKIDGFIDSQNAKFEGLIDAQNAKIEGFIDSQNAKMDGLRREFAYLRWMIGIGFSVLAIVITALRLLN